MIIGIGIDSIEIARFNHWSSYKQKNLLRFFSQEELDYCFSVPAKSAERLAVRFAAKEASYKAFSGILKNSGFLRWCATASVDKNSGGQPILKINWDLLSLVDPLCRAHLSLTHTKTCAIAYCIAEI
jgi:phosphopantetheine--protein transferase-like protein